MNVMPDLDWLQMDCDDNLINRQALRLACFTPLPFNAKNAASNVTGSSLLAITEEINKVNLLFKMKNMSGMKTIFCEIFKKNKPLLN